MAFATQYQLQHEDLIRKREKILQQKREIDTSSKSQQGVVQNSRRAVSEQRNKLYKLSQQDEESIKLNVTRLFSPQERGVNSKRNYDVPVSNPFDVDKVKERIFAEGLYRELSDLDPEYYEHMLPKIVGSNVEAVRAENTMLGKEIARLADAILQDDQYHQMDIVDKVSREAPVEICRPFGSRTDEFLRDENVDMTDEGHPPSLGDEHPGDSSMETSATVSNGMTKAIPTP